MIALQNRVEQRESHPLQRMALAQAALARYGLAGADLDEMPGPDGQDTIRASFPSDGAGIHPYLGRLASKSFTLCLLPPSAERKADALAWIEEMASLCRDTDEGAPEPVPACDGSLVTLVASEGEERQCVVYR